MLADMLINGTMQMSPGGNVAKLFMYISTSGGYMRYSDFCHLVTFHKGGPKSVT